MLAERLHMYLEKRRSFCPDGCKTALHEALGIPSGTTGKSHTIDFNKFQINFAIEGRFAFCIPAACMQLNT